MSMERQESLSLISSLRERSMKNKNKIYFFLVFLFMLLVLSNILGYMIGEIFYYCIKPFMYLLSAIILCYLIPNRKLIWLDHKLIDLFLVVGIIIVEILLFGAGIFFGFAHNPLQLTLEKLILNFFYLIVIVLAQEFMRIRLLRAIPQKNNKWYVCFVSIVLALGYCNLNSYVTSNLGMTVIRFYEQLLPNIVISFMLSYACLKGANVGIYIYMGIPQMVNILSPILPNIPWLITSLITITIPVFLYFTMVRLEQVTFKQKRKRVHVSSFVGFGLWGILIFSVLFVNRLFPIYPLAIASNSMAPAFSKGDVVILKKNRNHIYEVGDVIQFPTLKNTTYIHRIVRIVKQNQDIYYVTQGDNNDTVDLVPVESSQVMGKVVGIVKYIGYPTIWMYEQLNE